MALKVDLTFYTTRANGSRTRSFMKMAIITRFELPKVGQRYSILRNGEDVEFEVRFVDCDPDNEDIVLVLRPVGETATTPMPLSDFLKLDPERVINC